MLTSSPETSKQVEEGSNDDTVSECFTEGREGSVDGLGHNNTTEIKIGDRLWFKIPGMGTVSGRIQYYGQVGVTASSLRVGLVLDPEFKTPPPSFQATPSRMGPRSGATLSDGTYKGKRFFACEPGRGYFRKINECLRTFPNPTDYCGEDCTDDYTLIPAGPKESADSFGATEASHPPSEPFEDDSVSICSSSFASHTNCTDPDLCIGDRVMVKPSRIGTLKFIGLTKFAPGTWAGIELDQNLGKNDGSVRGIRYFKCRQNYGLFTKAKNVIRMGAVRATNTGLGLSLKPTTTTTNTHQHYNLNTELVLGPRKYSTYSLTRTDSQESLKSDISFVSLRSATSNNLRRTNTATAANTNATALSSSSAIQPSTTCNNNRSSIIIKDHPGAAQDAKNLEVERWLKENRNQKDEIDRITRMFKDKSGELEFLSMEHESFKSNFEREVSDLRTQVEEFEKQNEELESRLKEEKCKSEELQFQLEEYTISKDLLLVDNEVEKLSQVTEDDVIREYDLALEHKSKEIDRLGNEKDALKIRLQSLEMNWIGLNSEKEALNAQKDSLEEELVATKKSKANMNDHLGSELTNLRIERDGTKLELGEVRAELSIARTIAEELGQKLSLSDQQNMKLVADVDQKSIQISDLKESERVYKDRIPKLELEVERVQGLLNDRLDKLNSLEESLKMQSLTGDNQQVYSAQLEKAQCEALDKLKILTLERDDLERMVKEKVVSLEKLECQIMEKAEVISKLTSRMDKMANQHHTECQSLKGRLEKMENESLILQEQTRQGEEERAEESKREKMELLEGNEQKIMILRDTMMKEMEKRLVEEAKQRTEAWSSEKESYLQKMKELEQQYSSIIGQMEFIKRDKAEAEKNLKSALEKYNESSSQVKVLTEKLESQSSEIKGLQKSNKNMSDSISKSQEEWCKAKKELELIKQRKVVKDSEFEILKRLSETTLSELRDMEDKKNILEEKLVALQHSSQLISGMHDNRPLSMLGLNVGKQNNQIYDEGMIMTPDSINNEFGFAGDGINGNCYIQNSDHSASQVDGTSHKDCFQTQQFLNSVILDMNTQLEVLHKRIKELEEIPVSLSPNHSFSSDQEGDTSIDTGGFIHSPREFKAWTEVNNRLNVVENRSKHRKKYTKERDYCDNCQEFDLHDTTHCPKSSIIDPDNSGDVFYNPSYNQLDPWTTTNKNGVLPFQHNLYCKSCQTPGHDTFECRFMSKDSDDGRIEYKGKKSS